MGGVLSFRNYVPHSGKIYLCFLPCSITHERGEEYAVPFLFFSSIHDLPIRLSRHTFITKYNSAASTSWTSARAA